MSMVRVILILLGSTLFGCNWMGPRTVRQARFNYNEAIATSTEEQFLLNLVRLRYGHAPFFLQVGSVTTQYTFDASARWQWIIGFEDTSDEETTLGAGIGFSERPTITYFPLQGEELAQTLLRPLSLDTLFLLVEAGWDAEAVFHACVSRIGKVANSPQAGEIFEHAVALLKRIADDAEVFIHDDQGSLTVELRVTESSRAGTEFSELLRILGVDPSASSLKFVPYFSRGPGEVGISLRSPLAIMNVLSRSIDLPAKDLVMAHPANSNGTASTFNPQFRVHTSSKRPVDAYVSVKYRGAWFYVDPHDYRSTSTFGMLSYVFSLQAGGGNLLAPLQTLSIGN